MVEDIHDYELQRAVNATMTTISQEVDAILCSKEHTTRYQIKEAVLKHLLKAYGISTNDKSTNVPSTEDINEALETIDGLAFFAANHNCWTTPVPGLMKVMSYLRSLLLV